MGAYFAFDSQAKFIDKTCFMMIAKDVAYLQATLSSHLFEFAYKKIFSSVELGAHGYQYNKHALIKLPVCIAHTQESTYTDAYFYHLYGLTDDEVTYIEENINPL